MPDAAPTPYQPAERSKASRRGADGLHLKEMPKPAEPARARGDDPKAVAGVSILGSIPGTFKGRKLGFW